MANKLGAPLSMTANAIKKRAYYARKKGKQNTSTVGTTQTAGVPVAGPDVTPAVTGGEPPLTVNVKADLTPKPKPTLRERLGLGGGTKQAAPAPAKKAGGSKKVTTPNLITTVGPTMAAMFIAAWAKDRIPAEYQPCAPTQQEVKDVLVPLAEILGDEIEVAAKVSQNTLRLINSLLCAMAYGVRAYVTYVDIKKAREAGVTYEQRKQQQKDDYRARLDQEAAEYDAVINDVTADGEPSLAGGMRAYQGQNTGVGINPAGVNGSGPGVSVTGAASNGAANSDDDPELRKRENALIADMFKRDRAGRVRLGLLAV